MDTLKILIIEDETVLALHIANFLKRKEFETHIAVSYNEALNIMEKHAIDIIISDINIKGELDGITTCKTIQNLYNTPTIYLTAYRDEKTLQRASQTNFLGYLLKPFREDELDVLLQLSIKKLGLYVKSSLVQLTLEYSYNSQTKQLFFNSQEVMLTKKERQLFFLLLNHKNELVSFETIEEVLWSSEPVSDVTRRQLIYRLRQKLLKLNIENIKSAGMKLNL